MTTFNVSNSVELNSALGSAAGGDRIVLADGNYGKVNIFSHHWTSTVTIEAANPGAAHLDGLFVGASDNLTISGLDVGRALSGTEAAFTQLSWIKDGANIKLSDMTFHGSLDGDPSNDGIGLTVTNIAGFSLSSSEFHDLYRGVVLQKSTNSTIQDNDITLIRSDGIISIANQGLSIQGNHIGEFHPNLGDHADAIQFWNTNQTVGQSNITIKDNVIFQTYFSGVEQTGIQGIFMSDPRAYGYQNVLIQNNALYSNDAYNGIYVNGVTGVQILDNTVVSKSTDGKMFWIDVVDSADISVQNNVTDRIITSNVTNYFESGNVNFLADPAARSIVPNLIDPSGVNDLIASGVGYQVPVGNGIVPPQDEPPADEPPAEQPPAPPSVVAGDDGANTLVGGDGDDTLIGLGGADILIGGGGANTMQGGAGDDIYFVSSARDSVVEFAGEGQDQVRTMLSRLTLAAEVETLVYTGTGDFSGTGNDIANVIAGGAGADVLDGRGGRDVLVGADGDDILIGGAGDANTLLGGAGNDTYFVGVRGDSIVEFGNSGQDQVRTTLASYALPKHVESLVYLGTESFIGTGSDGANTIRGGGSADILNGAGGDDILIGGDGNDILIGGEGINTLQGGAGNDVYFVSNAQDSVVEMSGEGVDQVRTDLFRYTLSPEIEQLVYLGTGDFSGTGNGLHNLIAGGAGQDVLSGFGGDDALIGNGGADQLYGGDGADLLNGGIGADVLTGGAGSDQFLFNTPLGEVDRITDMQTSDRVLLDSSVFSALGRGPIAADAFATGSVAHDASDRILYDPTSGFLAYDADGSGAGAAHVFAQLGLDLQLAASNFVVI